MLCADFETIVLALDRDKGAIVSQLQVLCEGTHPACLVGEHHVSSKTSYPGQSDALE